VPALAQVRKVRDAIDGRAGEGVHDSGDPVLMPWAANVEAILQMWYPGQRGGPATARVLLGEVNPGGKLPVTFPADPTQISTFSADCNHRIRRRGAQVYLGAPRNPPSGVDIAVQKLVGFSRVELRPGEARRVELRIDRRDLSYWSIARHDWVVLEAARPILVGASSRDIRLRGQVRDRH
jgi:hypothetical protein